MKRPSKVKVDRISELPECIIHQIMSYLSTKEVAQTSLLSTRWYHMRKNYPVLGFYINEESRMLIHKSLHHFKLKKLSLRTFYVSLNDPKFSYHLEIWLRMALEVGMRELKLRLCGEAGGLTLPQPIFSTFESLTTLELDHCFLDQPLSAFSFLKKLSLNTCRLKNPFVLNNDDCPLLEVLVLESCFGFQTGCISNLAQLHTVEACLDRDDVYFDDNVDEEDDYFDDDAFEFVIAGPSIQRLCISCCDTLWSGICIGYCTSLKYLHLYSPTITDTVFHSILSSLSLLEELYMFRCDELEAITISSPRLKTLQVCVDHHQPLDYIGLEAPCLRNFICLNFRKQCVIKIADCCSNLVTLVLCWPMITEALFHNLVSRFPSLENLWILHCNELEMIQVESLRLKRLHIVECLKLKVLKVNCPNLCEFHITACEDPEVWVPNSNVRDDVEFEYHEDDSSYWWYRMDAFLHYSVGMRDEELIELVLQTLVPKYTQQMYR